MAPKRVANCDAIFGNPRATELEEVIDPLEIGLQANVEAILQIQTNTGREVDLQMV